MRIKILTIVAVGFLGLSTFGAYAQEAVEPAAPVTANLSTTVAEAQDAAIAACSVGDESQCSLALQALATTIRTGNPTLSAESLDGWILSSYRNVGVSVRAASGPDVNIAAIDRLAPPSEAEPAPAGAAAPAVAPEPAEATAPEDENVGVEDPAPTASPQ